MCIKYKAVEPMYCLLYTSEFMARTLTEIFISKNTSEYPSPEVLLQYIKKHNGKTEFLYFTDRAFWDSVHHVSMGYSPYADVFQDLLLKYQELDLTENKQISVTFSDAEELWEHLRENPICRNVHRKDAEVIPILNIESFTHQLPEAVYEQKLEKLLDEGEINARQADLMRIRRLQEGITIIAVSYTHLITDEHAKQRAQHGNQALIDKERDSAEQHSDPISRSADQNDHEIQHGLHRQHRVIPGQPILEGTHDRHGAHTDNQRGIYKALYKMVVIFEMCIRDRCWKWIPARL